MLSSVIDDEVETIYNLIPKPPPVIVKDPLHVSHFAGSTTFDTVNKRCHGTLGEPREVVFQDPKQFLRKNTRCRDAAPIQRPVPHGQATLTKPPVPRQADLDPLNLPPKPNFILENWKNAPKTKKLHPETPIRWYTDKPDFAQTPKYLTRVMRESRNEAAYWDGVREVMVPEDTETRCRLMADDKRIQIIHGLQANLADIKKRYGALSFGQDHLSFRKRKEGMEAQMAQLEADIITLSRANLYVTET
jgi:hypothetical protein